MCNNTLRILNDVFETFAQNYLRIKIAIILLSWLTCAKASFKEKKMSFFISDAMAEGESIASGGGFEALLPLVLLFVVFYFLLIRPQQKKVKEHKKLVEAIGKGAEVISYGGLAGKIVEIDDNFVDLEIADKVIVKVERQQISRELPKGTLKGK